MPTAVYTKNHIVAQLKLWRDRLSDARKGKGAYSVAACYQHIDRWLDELKRVIG